jgi:acyl carrier protein
MTTSSGISMEKLAGIIEAVTGTPAHTVTPATTFVDVGGDPLERYEIYGLIEAEFRLMLSERELEATLNMGELAALIDRKLAEQHARGRAA